MECLCAIRTRPPPGRQSDAGRARARRARSPRGSSPLRRPTRRAGARARARRARGGGPPRAPGARPGRGGEAPEAEPARDRRDRLERARAPRAAVDHGVGAEGEELVPRRGLEPAREHHHAEVPLAARPADEVEQGARVAARQVRVDDEDVEAEELVEEQREPGVAVGRRAHLEAAPLERGAEQAEHRRVVVEEERLRGPGRGRGRHARGTGLGAPHSASRALSRTAGNTASVRALARRAPRARRRLRATVPGRTRQPAGSTR